MACDLNNWKDLRFEEDSTFLMEVRFTGLECKDEEGDTLDEILDISPKLFVETALKSLLF